MNYTYNGINYKSGLSFNREGITILIPRERGLQIHFSQPGCAFAIPIGLNYGYNTINGICIPSFGDQQVDASGVYLYSSGSLSNSYSNCYDFPVMEFGTNSGTRLVRFCTVSGKFDCTLNNNNNVAISIKNGAFTFHNIEQ